MRCSWGTVSGSCFVGFRRPTFREGWFWRSPGRSHSHTKFVAIVYVLKKEGESTCHPSRGIGRNFT
ncbi:hypothetical protein QJS04_geneDACA016145 [Acorus gramineus]|uniref:Uncharacterized protein n=1 Tax=Acorus gramineus TaxID=55184 RepID=A0AAV9AMC7_ACOGR|nr:hypothetical protein QJS04_geneDACA016145 [Acorus gramineus]